MNDILQILADFQPVKVPIFESLWALIKGLLIGAWQMKWVALGVIAIAIAFVWLKKKLP